MCRNETAKNVVLGQRLNGSTGFRPRRRSGFTTTVIRCRRCDLHYADPLPMPDTLDQHYLVEPSAYWDAEYFNIDPNYFDSQNDVVKELVSYRPGMRVLDIGAGVGKFMLAMSSHGWEAWGIEPSATFRELAVERFKVNPERMLLASVENAAFEENFFEFVYMGAVLEHVVDPASALERALSWCAPGGVLYVEVPSSNWLIARIFNFFFALQGTTFVSNLSPAHSPYHLYEFGVKSFQEFTASRGVEIVRYENYICPIYHLPAFTHPILKNIMSRTGTGMQLALYLRKTGSPATVSM